MVQIGGDFNFPGWSGLIQANQNSLTLRASSSGDIIIGLDNNLIPEVGDLRSLGSISNRWNQLHAVSGFFTTKLQVLGSGVHFFGGRPEVNVGSVISPCATMFDLDAVSGIAGGTCFVHTFTESDETEIHLQHNMGTEDFTWSMWKTTTTPHQSMFANVAPSGNNHAIIEFESRFTGKLVLIGCL